VNSIQDFPTLGISDSASNPVAPRAFGVVDTRRGWGAVSKPPPTPIMSQTKTSPALSSSPTKKKTKNTQFVGTQPRILKKGEQLPKGSTTATQTSGKKNKSNKKHSSTSSSKTNNNSSQVVVSAASFFQPRLRESVNGNNLFALSGATGGGVAREMDGEEHQLLRLMQERTVYQKKGRQRVAPRKKKFTALKKKVLQERLDQWRTLHPEESEKPQHDDTNNGTGTITNAASGTSHKDLPPTCSLCIYNYAALEELEDEDEYEEIIENLKGMALKIGPIDEVFIPRGPIFEDEDETNQDGNDDDNKSNNHPAFVKFQKESDAAAALACWSGLVIGGSLLELFGLEVPSDDNNTYWSTRALAAESKRRKDPKSVEYEEISSSIDIILQKVLTDDDFEDEDCMSESLHDLKNIAMQLGEVQNIQANATENGDVVLTYHCNLVEARNIAESLCRVVLGGQQLYASVSEQPIATSGGAWSPMVVLLENILTEDDLEDSECLQESVDDIRELCTRHGDVSDIVVKGTGVKVTYKGDRQVAEKATRELNGIVLGGNVLQASLLIDEESATNDEGLENSIDLHNLVTEDDLEDEDCMEESLGDVRELASKHGDVVSIEVVNDADNSNAFVRIRFGGDASVAGNAVKGFGGMVIGGQIIAARLSNSGAEKSRSIDAFDINPGNKRKPDAATTNNSSDKKARTDDKAPLYSGDKLVSERFAEMKRVPKIPNKGPREYAHGIKDERVKPLLSEMLGELMRLQKRAVEDKNAKARRRMVMGLREVARGIRSHKVKMVVMANNLDDYGVIDEKLQEIIDLAKSEGVPLFFEFTKRSLGRAIGKSIKVAVVGIQNADGAHQPFKKLNAMASKI